MDHVVMASRSHWRTAFFPTFRAHIVTLDLRVDDLEIAARGDGFVAAIDDLHARLQMRGEALRRPILGAHGHAVLARKEVGQRGEEFGAPGFETRRRSRGSWAPAA